MQLKYGLVSLIIFVLLVSMLSVSGCNGCRSHTEGITAAGSGDAKEAADVTIADSDQSFELTANNCEFKWSCANALGQVQVGYFYELAGSAIVDDADQLKQIDIEFNMKELKANALSLSKKLQGPGFFQTDTFPTARFTTTSISTEIPSDAPSGTTHVIEANFQLRDVTKSISIPVAVEVTETEFTLSSEFKLDRQEYGIVHPVSLEDAAIQNDVVLAATIKVGAEVKVDEVATEKSQAIDLGEAFTEEIPATLVQFEMIRVPGSDQEGVSSFYLGKCEVTWEEFDYWALCKDQTEKQAVMLRNRELRPSAPHDLEATYRGWGREGQPAVGISKKSAELYCEWLSEQTGKKYRLPTLAEWTHAHELGGGDAFVKEQQAAWFEENSLDDDGFENRAMKVASLPANKIGIHDMLGNASEWVADHSMVVGGHFFSMADELSVTNTEQEDQKIWNATYPQLPKSIWWYKDADYVGFRVACDAAE